MKAFTFTARTVIVLALAAVANLCLDAESLVQRKDDRRADRNCPA
jgi:hypothetical protein